MKRKAKQKKTIVTVEASEVAPSSLSAKNITVNPPEKKEVAVIEKTSAPAVKQQISADIVSSLVLNGDVGQMTSEQKVEYYHGLCNALGLNPLTRPFQLIKLNGKQVLYAAKDATDQLRKINGVSVVSSEQKIEHDLCVCTVKVQDKTGKTDCEIGAVNVKGLAGDALANAMMKASTKAKRRATLSICGLGVLDETEIETIPGAMKVVERPESIHKESYDAKTDLYSQPLDSDTTPEIKDDAKNPLTSEPEKDHAINPVVGHPSYGKRWCDLDDNTLTKALAFFNDKVIAGAKGFAYLFSDKQKYIDAIKFVQHERESAKEK